MVAPIFERFGVASTGTKQTTWCVKLRPGGLHKIKVHIWPKMSGEDKGDGGIRRVIEGQQRSLPRLHVSFVSDPGDADVLACHAQIPDEYAKRFPDKPTVLHCHGLYWSDYNWMDWAYKVNREVLKSICSADAVTAPAEWVADVMRRHTSRRVTAVPHGVNSKEWLPPQGGHKGYVLWNKTRVDPVCEVDTLNALTAYAPDIQYVTTFGENRGNVAVTGKLPYVQAKELIRTAEVYLATSRETFGIGTIEAMACGVPVVGYRFGGQAEFIEHLVDGYLAAPGDYQDLVRGIKWAQENRETAGPAARLKAQQFTWEAAADKYLSVYREAIDRMEREHNFSPRVSIIVPAYNLEAYLPDTLRSIQAQKDEDWECIVVNDDSPDGCGEIADAFAEQDDRFRVIHNETNLYLAESRNVAIQSARGRYILPVDADDMITPDTVGMLADSLDSDRSLQSVYGNVLFTEEDGRTPRDYRTPGQTPGHSGWPVAANPSFQVQGNNLQPYASMFRKTAWESVGGYRRRLKTAEDADFWTRLASYGFRSQMVTKADTLIYRNREGSMSRAQNSKRFDYLKWFPWSKDEALTPAGLAGDKYVSLLTPHVSVIIPVGPGHGKLVQDAVDSVSAQGYKYWECIVVNDSGEDLLLPAWVYQIKCDARDTASARNIGIAASRGELFLPLDADDYLQPDALQWMVSAYSERGGNCIIYPDMFEDPDEAGSYVPYQFSDWSCPLFHLEGARMIHSVTALTPKRVWQAVGGYTEGMQWEDWDFQLKAAETDICIYRVAAPLFTYRKWTGTRRTYESKEELQARIAVINERWGAYRRGEKHFMACGCQGSTVKPPVSMGAMNREAVNQWGDDAILVEYIGAKAGSVRYKGNTPGVYYSFALGDEPSYVAAADVHIFAGRADFRLHLNATPKSAVGSDPVLVA